MQTHRFERQSGIILACVAMAVALWPWTGNDVVSWPWLLVSLSLLLLSWLVPGALRPLAKFWLSVGHLLAYLNTLLLLAVVYFGLVTPVALLFRLMGREVLALKSQKAASYWKTESRQWSPDSFKNQF